MGPGRARFLIAWGAAGVFALASLGMGAVTMGLRSSLLKSREKAVELETHVRILEAEVDRLNVDLSESENARRGAERGVRALVGVIEKACDPALESAAQAFGLLVAAYDPMEERGRTLALAVSASNAGLLSLSAVYLIRAENLREEIIGLVEDVARVHRRWERQANRCRSTLTAPGEVA